MLGTVPHCRTCGVPMQTLGSCQTCNTTGLIAGGAIFCLDCNGHGARYVCRNFDCSTGTKPTTEQRSAPPPPRPSSSPPPPAPMSTGHAFEQGRCSICGKLRMLAEPNGWPCREPYYAN